MAGELVYTSVPKGLNKGESGFCVVACSADIPPILLNRLEAMSSYREIFNALDPQAEKNPVNYSSTHVVCGKQRFRIISRIAFAGLDYSGRSNKIADHLILNDDEITNAGPAELLSIKDLFYSKWDSVPVSLPYNAKVIPEKIPDAVSSGNWLAVTGDQGWAEHLIEYSNRNIDKPIYIISQLGIDNLALCREALKLLPVTEQWNYTLSTYCSSNIQGINYRWRFVFPGTDIYHRVIKNPHVLKFDLNNLPEQMLKRKIESGGKYPFPSPLRIKPREKVNRRPEKCETIMLKNNNNPAKRHVKSWLFGGFAVLLLLMLIYLLAFSEKTVQSNNTAPGGLVIEKQTPASIKPSRSGVKNIKQTPVNDSVASKIINIPQIIVLDKKDQSALMLTVPLPQAVKQTLDKTTDSLPETVELKFQVEQSVIKSIAKKYQIDFIPKAPLQGSGSITLLCRPALQKVLDDLADNIEPSAFLQPPRSLYQNTLLKFIQTKLADKCIDSQKNYYEHSAEYLLGEFYADFKQRYQDYQQKYLKNLKQKAKLQSNIRKYQLKLKRCDNELSDNGMELERRAAVNKTRSELKAKLAVLKQSLEAFKKPHSDEDMKTCRIALLRAFFCFGKNYMTDAETMISFKKNTGAAELLRKNINKSNIAQQLNYANEFKHTLDNHVYQKTLTLIIREAEKQLGQLRFSLVYIQQNKKINLVIEDSKYEK